MQARTSAERRTNAGCDGVRGRAAAAVDLECLDDAAWPSALITMMRSDRSTEFRKCCV